MKREGKRAGAGVVGCSQGEPSFRAFFEKAAMVDATRHRVDDSRSRCTTQSNAVQSKQTPYRVPKQAE